MPKKQPNVNDFWPSFFWDGQPVFFGRLLAWYTFYSLAKFCWVLFADLCAGNIELECRIWRGWVTSLPKVIWEEGHVAAQVDTSAVNFPLVPIAHPKFAPKSTPSRGPIPKPHYLAHPWTHPTYDAKRHTDPLCHFSTMHWTDQQMYRPTNACTDRRADWQIVHGKVWWL